MVDLGILESGSFVQQILVLDEIEKSGDKAYAPPLVALLARENLDESLRQAVTDTLQSVLAKNPDLVVETIEGPPSPALWSAIQLVGRKRLESARAPLAALAARTTDSPLLVDILSALGEVADHSVLHVFRDCARLPDPFVAALSIRQLGAMADRDSLPFVKELLIIAEGDEVYEDCSLASAAAVEALNSFGDAEALDALVCKIHHRNPTIRRLIHEILVTRGEAVVDTLGSFLEAGDTDEKIMAVALLGQIRSPRGVELILSALDRGKLDDINVRFAVYDAFGNIPSLKTMICLVDGLSESDEMTLVAVASSLNRILNPGVIMKVRGALTAPGDHADKVARAIVGAGALELFKAVYTDEQSASVLVRNLLAVKDCEARETFAAALEEIGGEKALADAALLRGVVCEAKRRRILAVDDSRSILMFYRAALAELGYEVVTAEHGKAALMVLAFDTAFDLIITDMNMPEMNGIEFTRNVRENMLVAHLPVLMATTESDQSQVELATRAGVSGYIVKPIKPQALEEALRSALG